jgi:polyisoprenoid-binding protein YceI
MISTRLSILPLVAAVSLLLANSTKAADWMVVPEKSQLGFEGTMAGVAFKGIFQHWAARINFDPAQPGASHATVIVDMFSAVTGDRQKDDALPQSDWFDANTFPKAIFEAQSFRSNGGNRYEAIGTLTIRNITKPAVIPMSIEVTGASLHASGRLNLVRTDYGVGQGAWSSAQWVALDVVATFEVTAQLHL